jgi:NADPH:quinone reductase-like Zn-dependent oxidoreductase
MKAIGYTDAGPISAENALIEFETDIPGHGPNDLLVEVRGISVNPVDVKVRTLMQPDGSPRILGFDAAGVVKAAGSDVTRFRPGDEVFARRRGVLRGRPNARGKQCRVSGC